MYRHPWQPPTTTSIPSHSHPSIEALAHLVNITCPLCNARPLQRQDRRHRLEQLTRLADYSPAIAPCCWCPCTMYLGTHPSLPSPFDPQRMMDGRRAETRLSCLSAWLACLACLDLRQPQGKHSQIRGMERADCEISSREQQLFPGRAAERAAGRSKARQGQARSSRSLMAAAAVVSE